MTDAASSRAESKRRHRRTAAIGSLVLFLGLVATWQAASSFGLVHRIILPPPWDVALALAATFQDAFFYRHLSVTVVEVVVGFLVGSAIGFSLGSLLGVSAMARAVAYPYIVAFQGLPKVVLAPLFITASGFGITSKIVMAVAISFFPLLIDTMSGLMSVDPDAVRLMRSYKATRLDILRRLSIPHALPQVFAGLKTAVTLALVGALVGEFVGASEGVGYLLSVYTYQLQIDRVYALTIILALIGVALFLALELLDRWIVFWATERQLETTM